MRNKHVDEIVYQNTNKYINDSKEGYPKMENHYFSLHSHQEIFQKKREMRRKKRKEMGIHAKKKEVSIIKEGFIEF